MKKTQLNGKFIMNKPGTISAKVFYTRHTFRTEHSKTVIFCDRTVYE